MRATIDATTGEVTLVLSDAEAAMLHGFARWAAEHPYTGIHDSGQYEVPIKELGATLTDAKIRLWPLRPLRQSCVNHPGREATRLTIRLDTLQDAPMCDECIRIYGLTGRALPLVETAHVELPGGDKG